MVASRMATLKHGVRADTSIDVSVLTAAGGGRSQCQRRRLGMAFEQIGQLGYFPSRHVKLGVVNGPAWRLAALLNYCNRPCFTA